MVEMRGVHKMDGVIDGFRKSHKPGVDYKLGTRY